MSDRDCAQKGHIWLEDDGTRFNRLRDLTNSEPRPVHCEHCGEVAVMVGYGVKRP